VNIRGSEEVGKEERRCRVVADIKQMTLAFDHSFGYLLEEVYDMFTYSGPTAAHLCLQQFQVDQVNASVCGMHAIIYSGEFCYISAAGAYRNHESDADIEAREPSNEKPSSGVAWIRM
jgi:hypothetical protein